MTRTTALSASITLLAGLALAALAPHATVVARAQGRTAPQSMRLYVFDGGILASDPARYQMTKEDVGTTELSVAAYLVVHPKGVMMWDTGAVPDSDWKPTGKPAPQRLVLADGQERNVTLTRSLQAQLAEAGYKAADVTHLALSHYHWDHTANANAFAGALWLVRQEERDAMFKPGLGTTRPATYASLEKSRTTIITDDEHDVFGDGTVVLKRAAGHTQGHQVLYLKLARTGGVVLSGDIYHYPQERTLDRVPIFELNQEQTRMARRALDVFLSKTGAQLWIQHNLASHNRLRKAPQFYD